MNKKSIEQEAEELLRKCLNANKDDTEPEATSSEFTEPALTNKLRNEIKKFLAGASRSHREQQRQAHADTWDAAVVSCLNGNNPDYGIDTEIVDYDKEDYLNNLFPSEIKGEQQP